MDFASQDLNVYYNLFSLFDSEAQIKTYKFLVQGLQACLIALDFLL